jgi:hypothetical protein
MDFYFPRPVPVRKVADLKCQAAHFPRKMSKGQLEAVFCLRVFFLERLKIFIDQFEDDFMEAYGKVSHIETRSVDGKKLTGSFLATCILVG